MKRKSDQLEDEIKEEDIKSDLFRKKGIKESNKNKIESQKEAEQNKIENSKKTCLAYIEYIEKKIKGDGNCFFRAVSYYYRNNEDDHAELRLLLYQWLNNNRDLFINMIPEEDSLNRELTLEERRKKLKK